MIRALYDTREYLFIKDHYGESTTARSGVPLINHIDEGIEILSKYNASEQTARAYCLHPVFQGDIDLAANYHLADQFDPKIVLLVMEYRKCANAYLCKPHTDNWTQDDIRLFVGPLLPEVRHMLIADKIQNRKDFLKYHYGTHPRSEQLNRYFNNWIVYLEHQQ